MRTLVLLLLALVAFCAPSFAQEPSEYLKLQKQGVDAINAGKFEEGIAIFTKCLELRPEDPFTAYNLGCTYAKKTDKDKAFEWLDKAAEWGFGNQASQQSATGAPVSNLDFAQRDTDLTGLHEDPRWAKCIDKMTAGRKAIADFDADSAAVYIPKALEGVAELPVLVVLHAENQTKNTLVAGRWKRIADAAGCVSGGQRQRVAMGRAIVRNPSVFLFDEPLSNLDAKLRIQMRLEIKTLQQSLRTTSIYVTHDQVEAMTLADRLIVMNEGKVEQIGPPMKLYEDPETTFVAGFIGAPSMNFLNGSLADDRNSVEITGDTGQPLKIPVVGSKVRQPGPILLGIRPEHLVMASEGEVGAISLKIHAAEPLGADTLLYGRLGSDGGIVAARASGHVQNVVGDRRWFKASRGDYFLFDPGTGKRVRGSREG